MSLKPAVPRIVQALGISASSAKRLIRDGLIPVVRVGRQFRIDEDRLARWIADGGAGAWRRPCVGPEPAAKEGLASSRPPRPTNQDRKVQNNLPAILDRRKLPMLDPMPAEGG
jgi:excisionase family DNA binding protein